MGGLGSAVGGLGSRTPSSEMGLATVTEESQSWSRKEQQRLEDLGEQINATEGSRVEHQEIGAHRKGPRSPKQRRSVRRPYSAGIRIRLPGAGRAVSQGSGSYGGAWSELAVGQKGVGVQPRGLQHPGIPQLVDSLGNGVQQSATWAASEDGEGGIGQGIYIRRRLPLKEEFRQMVHDNKTRSEALKRSVEAIESLSGALDANQAEKQLLVKVLMSCAHVGTSTPREGRAGAPPGLRAGAGVGVGRRSQTAFIGQMLAVSSEERGVLEGMPATLIDAVEDAMRTKMAYAEAVARMAELDEELLEWQRWYSKEGGGTAAKSIGVSAPTRDTLQPSSHTHILSTAGVGHEVSPRERMGGHRGVYSPRGGEAGNGPVAAAYLRSQLSQARVENEHLSRKLQQLQVGCHVFSFYVSLDCDGVGLTDFSKTRIAAASCPGGFSFRRV